MSAVPMGGTPPDMKIINTHALLDAGLGYLGPVSLLHGFDEFMGPPPMPNGFMFHGGEADVMTGAYGRLQSLIQAGQQFDNISVFAAFSTLQDQGWQQHSPTRSNQFYGDIGYRANGNEFHLSAQYMNSAIMGAPMSPVQLIQSDPTAQINWPTGFTTEALHVNLSGNYLLDNGWTARTNLSIGRTQANQQFTPGGFQVPVNGCPSNAALLCSGNAPYMALNGTQFKNILLGTGKAYATNDLLLTGTTAWGVTAAANNHGEVFGRPNNFTIGVNYNGGSTTAIFHQYLGVFGQDGQFQDNQGETNFAPGGQPQNVGVSTTFVDPYLEDVIDVTDKLKIGLGMRFDYSKVAQDDRWNTVPTATKRTFFHFSPSLGASYAITPGLVLYGGYWEQAQVLTPAGMFCTDPESVCSSMAPWFGANQILNQSVYHNLEVGLRGQSPVMTLPGLAVPVQIAWNAAYYHTYISDYDYLSLSTGPPAFTDVGNALFQGVRAGIELTTGKVTTAVNYVYTDARFLSPFSLFDPPNPAAVNSTINVTPGKVIPVQPYNMLKVSASYQVTDNWAVGTSLRASSGAFYFSDEVNALSKYPGYYVWGLNTQYRLNSNLELFGIMENALNRQYVLLGGLLPTNLIPLQQMAGATNPESWALGQPFSIYGGFRLKF
jgi:iron complex outermembrane recepter protein